MKRYDLDINEVGDLEITEDDEGEYCLASDVDEEIDRITWALEQITQRGKRNETPKPMPEIRINAEVNRLLIVIQEKDKRIAELEEENKRLAKIHEEYRPDVQAGLSLKGWQQENAELQDRIADLENELAEYTAAEANDPKTWPTVTKQMKRIAELGEENERLRYLVQNQVVRSDEKTMQDAERYRKWKENGLSYSNGYYHLDLYMYDPDGIREYRSPDDVADAAMERE